MTKNPYNSPVSVENNAKVRSRELYAVASAAVIAFWIVLIAAIAWYGELSITGDEVSLHFPSHTFSPTPSGDPMISTQFFYATTTGVALLLGIAVATSLIFVNGIIALTQR